MVAYFNSFTIEMTRKQAESASHQGQCDKDVAELLKDKKIQHQLAKISNATLTDELREYGAWDDEELKNRSANNARIIWIAACNIVEESRTRRR